MTNIQLLFFSGLFAAMIVAQFVILYKMRKLEKVTEELQDKSKKALDFCNTLYDKLKEIVDKINPLLKVAPDTKGEVHEAEIKEAK
jgi:hypothetical protein